jgi:hypothetical protein
LGGSAVSGQFGQCPRRRIGTDEGVVGVGASYGKGKEGVRAAQRHPTRPRAKLEARYGGQGAAWHLHCRKEHGG